MTNGENNHIQPIKREAVPILVLLIFFIFLSICLIGTVDAEGPGQSGYSLVGTIQSGDFTGAVISVSKNEQTFFRVGEKLPDGSKIVKVMPDNITLKGADGTLYNMYISHETVAGSAVSPASADSYASESAQKPGPTSAQQERIDRIRQQTLERAQRRKNRGDE